MRKYEVYNINTGEIYNWGYNSFTAMCNLVAARSEHGEENVNIRWL